jgi:adenylate kinase
LVFAESMGLYARVIDDLRLYKGTFSPMASPQQVLFFPFIALPNGGKGTQTKLLSEAFAMPRVDMGAMLREIAKEATPLAQAVQARLSQGQLVELATVIEVLKVGIEKQLAGRTEETVGFILDGFPRSLEQCEALQAMMPQLNARVGAAILLDVPVEVIRGRAENRRVCGDCGAIYNLNSQPPKQAGVCDACGSTQLVHRVDDQPENVTKRLESFTKETQPVLDFYSGQSLLKTINGHREIQAVFADLKQAVEPFFALQASTR